MPILDDLIKISSTVRSLGNSLISDMLYLEHFIDLGIFFIIVSGVISPLSKPIATVKVLNIEPNS